jgi:inner membrane transporter RhtA
VDEEVRDTDEPAIQPGSKGVQASIRLEFAPCPVVHLGRAGAFAVLVVLLVDGPSEPGRVTWHALLIMLALAALYSVLTFSLEYLSLRGLTAKAFGTLMSLEPAIALLAGLLVLGQIPNMASAVASSSWSSPGSALSAPARAPARQDHHFDTPCLAAAPEPDPRSPT